MYYYNQHSSYDPITRHQNYYNTTNNSGSNQHYSTQKFNKSNRNQQSHNTKPGSNFSSRFVDYNQNYSEYENASSYSSNSSPTSFYHQYYDHNSYNQSLSSSFDSSSDESVSYLTASLSSSTSSLEFPENPIYGYYSDGQPIWSSALYSPNLHPTLFESWSTKMNKSIIELNEELKNYDRILGPDYDSNAQFSNQVEYNINHMYDLFSYHQQQFQKQPLEFKPRSSNSSQGIETNLISYEEMTTKVDNLLNLSFQENSLSSAGGRVTGDMTVYQNGIHVSTSNESLEGGNDSDDKSNKSVSPKLKFTAPRFEKKWLKTQAKHPVASNNTNNNNNNNAPNPYPMNCQNICEFSPKQPQQHQQQIKLGFSSLKKFSEVTTATECQKNISFNNRNNNANKWPSQSTIKSINKNSNQTNNNNNNNNYKYNNNHASNGKYQASSRNCLANENEASVGSGSNTSNGSGYRARNSNKQQANNRYRFNRAGSKSRA